MPDLDSIVKGAAVPEDNSNPAAGTNPNLPFPGKQGDPTNNAPNSPSMIYLNLLILEASLRAQYLELRARRRHHTFFFMILAVWIAWWGYQLFYAPERTVWAWAAPSTGPWRVRRRSASWGYHNGHPRLGRRHLGEGHPLAAPVVRHLQ
uniref:Uncharacterized protein n=1 Tax=Bionectria ochroleuca TaxID=29856 RepID=A0A8H7NP72_BIOOC